MSRDMQDKDNSKLITTTVRDYDLAETSKLVRAVYFGCAMMAFMHIYLKCVSVSRSITNYRLISTLLLPSLLPCRISPLAPLSQVHATALHPSTHGPQDALRREARPDPPPRQARRGRPQATVQGWRHVRRRVGPADGQGRRRRGGEARGQEGGVGGRPLRVFLWDAVGGVLYGRGCVCALYVCLSGAPKILFV